MTVDFIVRGKTWKDEITKKWLNRREKSDTYLTHVCRLPLNIERNLKE